MKAKEWMDPKEITKYPPGPDGKYRRNDFVLMDLKIRCPETQKEREVAGWWTGRTWDGLRVERSDNIVAWRRRYGA